TIEIQNVIMESLTRLAQSGEPKVYKYLISELASVHEISRKHAAQLLTQIPEKKEVLRQFLTYTRGIATWLRDRAFETMQPIASNISNEVIELLQEDDDILLKIDTMFLGAYLNDLRIIPYITEIIENNYDWWVKISAIEIVGKMKVKEMLPILEHHQNNPELILSIISVYGEIQDPDNIPFLLECLQSTSKSIGLETVRALGKYSHPKVSQVLQNLAQYHENWILQDEAQKILKEQGQIVPLTDRPLQYELNSEESFLELQELQKTMEFEKQKKEENIALLKLREKQEETENTIEIKELYEDNFQDIDIYEKQEVSVRKIDPIQLDISLGKPLQQEPIKTIPIIPPKVQNFPSILRSIPKSETSNQE
ncbi:MAG TPA: HEAT repeat domain-containing protein, partial [Planctomycetota bacterium]|nr:HEAT repeat domain-containing protein [Planctomycetota bacterium]